MYERIRAVMQPPTGKEKLRRQSGGVVVIILSNPLESLSMLLVLILYLENYFLYNQKVLALSSIQYC